MVRLVITDFATKEDSENFYINEEFDVSQNMFTYSSFKKYSVYLSKYTNDAVYSLNILSKKYLQKNLSELAENLKSNEKLQYKIDHWVRVTAYKYILRNTHQFGDLISATVGNWQGKELSEKLELEVGKDLQFIRVNGTLVGGLVGLVIYTIANFFI